MKDLPQGSSVQIVKKSTQKSMFDIYARPMNFDDNEGVIKLEWNVVEYGEKGKPARASAHGNMNFDTAAKIAHDILAGHPFAAKLPVLQEVEQDLMKILNNINGKADKEVKRMIIEKSLSEAVAKAYLYPNRIRENWTRKQDRNGTYYQVMISGGGKGKKMIESRYILIEAREYNGALQYHVSAGVTEGIKGPKGEVLPKEGAPVTRAKTIVKVADMCEAMEKLLLFIQGSVTYDVARGTYRPFTVNTYQGDQENQGNQGNNNTRQNKNPGGHTQNSYNHQYNDNYQYAN